MSDDGFDDDFDDAFGFYDDLEYQDDDDLSALVDSMAETAFAQGDPVWDEFDAEYGTTEYHSDWSYYSDGGFFSDEEKAPGEGGAGKSKDGITARETGTEGRSGVASGAKANASGRPLRKRRKLMVVDESGKRVPESAPIPSPAKVTATVIVPLPPTPPRKLPTSSPSDIKKANGKQPSKQKDAKKSTSVDGLRAAMKRKPSTDEGVSP